MSQDRQSMTLLDEADVDRLWRGVQGRRVKRARRRAQMWVVAAAATLLLVVGFAFHRPRPPLVTMTTPAALTFAGGGIVDALPSGRLSTLSDGSTIALGPGAVFTPKRNDGTAFEGTLRDGVGTFSVMPGGPRRWSIDCGLATVEVVGTKFEIDAHADRVTVRVERGHVRVKSNADVTELFAGDTLRVPTLAPPAETVAPTLVPSALPNAPAATPMWRGLVHEGRYDAAYESLGASGIDDASSHASIDDLFALADVARLSGHAVDAVTPLTRIMNESGADARRALAAFSLGRIDLDTLGQPAAAARAFARAIELGLPSNLVEDGHARLVEARAKSGDYAGARRAYDAYRRAFPGGTRATAMKSWLRED